MYGDMKPSEMYLVVPVVVIIEVHDPDSSKMAARAAMLKLAFETYSICDVQTWNWYKKQWESLHIKYSNYWNKMMKAMRF